jgi:hypothetical protein
VKRIIGSIPIIAVLVLLFGVVFNIVEQPQTALAVSPVIKVYAPNSVPGSGISADQNGAANDGEAHVQTDWAHEGTVLLVRVESGGIVATDTLDSTLSVLIETDDDDDLVATVITESAFDTAGSADGGFIQFEIEILSATGATTSTVGSLTFVGADRFKIRANKDDDLKISISPSGTNTIDVARSHTIGIENSVPKIKNVSPSNGDVVDDTDVDIEYSITDKDSGIPEPEDMPDTDGDDEYVATVVLVSDGQCTEAELDTGITTATIHLGTLTCALGTNPVTVVSVGDENDFDDITDGFDVETAAVLASNATRYITMVAFDKAGNYLVYDGDDDAGEAMLEITTDTIDPDLTSARTGVSWDSVDDEYDDGRDWIQAIFTDTNDLSSASIDDADIVVEGHTVKRVQWFDVDPEDVTEDFDGGVVGFSATAPFAEWQLIRHHIFIQLEDDMEPDETPDINIVPDGIDDEAGNNLDSDDVGADDTISPIFTIESLTGPNDPKLLAGEDEEMEVIFTSDEDIDGDPDVTVSLAPQNGTDTGVGAELTVDVDEIGTNRWRATIDEPDATGFYNIWIEADDDEGNTGDNGGIDPAGGLADFFDDGDVDSDAVYFEGDISLNDPYVTIDGEEIEIDEDTFEYRDPFFIEIDFTTGADGNDDNWALVKINENAEYDEDSFDDITITLFELDDVDITDLVTTTDDQRFLIAIDNIAIGEHDIVITAVDEAGNDFDDDVERTFEVEERDAFERALKPGWNLASIPADPADPSIDVVIGSDVPVTTVYTFDPTVPGGWLVAVRETYDDPWVGDLQEITSNRGYWIMADQIEDWEVEIPRLPGGAVSGGTPIQPPIIDLFPGWNLVPIVDVTGTALTDSVYVDADDYFESARDEIARILAFDTIKNEWSTIPFAAEAIDNTANADSATPATDELDDKDIAFGDAVWVYATEAATLVPGGTVLE